MIHVNLANARCVVVVFAQEGCPACEEYVPRFQAVAAQYSAQVPSAIVDASDKRYEQIADTFQINATPTTLVLRKPTGAIKAEGSLPNTEISKLFAVAARS